MMSCLIIITLMPVLPVQPVACVCLRVCVCVCANPVSKDVGGIGAQ